MDNVLLLFLIVPLAAGVLALFIPKKVRGLSEALVVGATLLTLVLAAVFFKNNLAYSFPWVPAIGLDFSLRLYRLSSFILISVACFGFLVGLYSTVSLADKPYAKRFFAYFLLTGFAVLRNPVSFELQPFLVQSALAFWKCMLCDKKRSDFFASDLCLYGR